MSIIVPDVGEVALLTLLLKTPLFVDAPFHMHLYSNDYLPVAGSVVGSFTEATFAGYVVQQLDRIDWGDPVTVGGVAYSLFGIGLVSWLATSGNQDIYGYYVTDDTDTVLLWAERFPAVVNVSTAIPVLVQPLMRLQSEI